MDPTAPGTTCTITRHDTAAARDRLTLEVEADYHQPFVDAMRRLPAYDCIRSQDGRWWVAPRHLPRLIPLAQGFDEAWLIEGDQRTDLKAGQRA
jgi:hypothetical protein